VACGFVLGLNPIAHFKNKVINGKSGWVSTIAKYGNGGDEICGMRLLCVSLTALRQNAAWWVLERTGRIHALKAKPTRSFSFSLARLRLSEARCK
jgi:hypothetical protein